MLRVTRQNYDTWLRSTMGCHYEGTTLIVKTNSDLACDWLSTKGGFKRHMTILKHISIQSLSRPECFCISKRSRAMSKA